MFVRKCHRGNGHGLQILEDFVDSFKNDCLGLKYPLSTAMYKGNNQSLQGHDDEQILDNYYNQCTMLGMC